MLLKTFYDAICRKCPHHFVHGRRRICAYRRDTADRVREGKRLSDREKIELVDDIESLKECPDEYRRSIDYREGA